VWLTIVRFNTTNGVAVGNILTSPHLPDAQIMAPNHAPMYAIFNITNIYTSYYFELLQHEDFLHMGVASVQAVIDQLRAPDQEPSQNVLRHIGKAMSNLRRRLERPGATADDLTIMVVLFLAVATVRTRNPPSTNKRRQWLTSLAASHRRYAIP
jgi:hypothetical protein